ncbi:unnamed protein product [Alopecurus aequalis]
MKASLRSRQEPRRVSNGVIIAAMLLSLCVLSIVKARYCSTPFGPGKPEDQLQEQMNSSIRMETDDEPAPAAKTAAEEEEEDVEEEDESGPAAKVTEAAAVVTSSGAGKKDTKSKKKQKPTCFMTSKRSERCEAAGDIRVVGNASVIYADSLDREWTTKPYARYHDPVAMSHVREFTLKPFPTGAAPPACTKNHSVTGFVFSNRGFSGNLYHDYTDVLFPLFLSTHKFHGDVQFLLSDMKPWWVAKFRPLFRQLSKYEVADVNNDLEVHCFPRIVVGSDFHKDMGIIPSKAAGHVSVVDFKRTLRDAFGLERAAASRGGAQGGSGKPRLLIISRKSSRRFLNEREMGAAAAEMGFEVRIAEPDQHTDMATFARLVNSADAMIGVHGAGLTNMVFLPAGAVLVQVVPFGGLEWLTGVTFKDPAADMEVTYMDYNVELRESSLLEQYPRGHQVLTDPYAIHKQGWDALKAAYLDKQNVRLDLDKFRAKLREVLAALPPASTST